MEPNVLSIQSWVCHGFVGNKCAVFALQTLGIDVDAINTVQFSNHTGYPSFTGKVLSGAEVWELVEGLIKNKIAHYSHLLTGYNSSVASLRNVVNIRKTLKEINPNLIHVCDPVMGDNGKLYIPEEVVKVYQEEILPGTDYLLPNQTEAEYLTGIPIKSELDALKSLDILHEMGAKNVVITSLYYGESDEIIVIGSSPSLQKEKSYDRFRIKLPRLKGYFSGTGDLFSALLLAWSHKLSQSEPNQHSDLKKVTQKVLSSLRLVIERTIKSSPKTPTSDVETSVYAELKLVQSYSDIQNPPNLFSVEEL